MTYVNPVATIQAQALFYIKQTGCPTIPRIVEVSSTSMGSQYVRTTQHDLLLSHRIGPISREQYRLCYTTLLVNLAYIFLSDTNLYHHSDSQEIAPDLRTRASTCLGKWDRLAVLLHILRMTSGRDTIYSASIYTYEYDLLLLCDRGYL